LWFCSNCAVTAVTAVAATAYLTDKVNWDIILMMYIKAKPRKDGKTRKDGQTRKFSIANTLI
jgi:hypothetical protein